MRRLVPQKHLLLAFCSPSSICLHSVIYLFLKWAAVSFPPSLHTHTQLLHPQTEALTPFVGRSEALVSCRSSKQVTGTALFLLLLLTVSQTWISQSAPRCPRGGGLLSHQQWLCVCLILVFVCLPLAALFVPDACLETDLEITSS